VIRLKIVLLSTGGTIASKKNPETGRYMAGAMTGEELASLCELPDHMDIEVESVLQVPSNQMNFEYFIPLKQKIEEVFQDKEVDGIVVTHGTDTMEETAYFLDLTIADERPVVMTGSQRVPDALGSDAYPNVRQAILVAGHADSRSAGTLVLFNERIYAARHVMKYHASNLDGFMSPGYGYLGTVDEDQVYFYQKPLRRGTYAIGDTLPDVEIVKSYAGAKGWFVTSALEAGAKGLILEGTGRGHVAPPMMEAIRAAAGKGMTIVITSGTLEGEVHTVYDFAGSAHEMQETGVILARDDASRKARVKLAVLLAAGERDIAGKFSR
jgi:L-asparaginase